MAKYFQFPFAENGNRAAVPDTTAGSTLSYEFGYGPAYELPKTNPDRLNIDRQTYNTVLFDATSNIKEWQEQCFPSFIQNDGSGSAYSYPIDSIVKHEGVLYQSIVNGTTTTPPSNEWIGAYNVATQNINVTVGSGGQFSSINSALGYLSKMYPRYANTGIKSTVNLLAGFVMSESVQVISVDLSWIEITGEDAETVIDRGSLTVDISGGNNIYPAFGVKDGGKGPKINQAFTMNRSGSDILKIGVYAYGAGSSIFVSPQAGVKSAYGTGLLLESGASCTADYSDFSQATAACVSCFGSRLSFIGGKANQSGSDGIRALDSSEVNASGAEASNCALSGLFARGASSVNFSAGIARFNGTRGVSCDSSARVNASQANLTSNTTSGAAANGGEINASSASCRIGVSDNPQDITCTSGGIVVASLSTGGTSITVNTVTSSGIIFK